MGSPSFAALLLLALLQFVPTTSTTPVGSQYQGLGQVFVDTIQAAAPETKSSILCPRQDQLALGSGRVLGLNGEPMTLPYDALTGTLRFPVCKSSKVGRACDENVQQVPVNATDSDSINRELLVAATGLELLADHYSGSNAAGFCDKEPITVYSIRSVQTDKLFYSGDKGVNPMKFRFPSGETRGFHLGEAHSVSVVIQRRQKVQLVELSFFTTSRDHEAPVQGVLKPGQRRGDPLHPVDRTLLHDQPLLPSLMSLKATTLRRTRRKSTSVSATKGASRASVVEGTGTHAAGAPLLLADLRFLNFNVWNYNGDWPWRASRLAALIKRANPTIAVLQEIRIDHTFDVFLTNAKLSQPEEQRRKREYTLYGPVQSAHLLRQIRHKLPLFFDFVPGMMYWNRDDYTGGIRFQLEGPMIAHKVATTLLTVPFYLSRMPGHPQDDHQRVLLCSILKVPVGYSDVGGNKKKRKTANTGESPETDEALADEEEKLKLLQQEQKRLRKEKLPHHDFFRVDVCTVHFTLAAEPQLQNARDTVRHMGDLAACKTMRCLLRVQARSQHGTSSGIPKGEGHAANHWEARTASQKLDHEVVGEGLQEDEQEEAFVEDQFGELPPLALSVLAGDLNAEPNDASIQYLIKNAPFNDTWLQWQQQDAEQRKILEDPNTKAPTGNTFNAQSKALTKRIDFVLTKTYPMRVQGGEGSGGAEPEEVMPTVEVKRFDLLGERGAKGTPPAASDHLGILTRLQLIL